MPKDDLMEDLFKDVTPYCNAAIDAVLEYCIQEFKKACDREGITWDESWEDVLHGK